MNGFYVVKQVIYRLSVVELLAILGDEPSTDCRHVDIYTLRAGQGLMQIGPSVNALLLAFRTKPLSVRSSPCSEYRSSLATLLAEDGRERNVATPSKVTDGKCGRLLFRDLRSRHEPFKLSKMTAVGVFVAIVPVWRTDMS